MKKLSEKWLWPASMMALWTTILLALYGKVFLHPDAYMFSNIGDGVKNYFTFAWHVRHDADWLRFGGMNYPNGEHVCYTDGHPLFSLLLGWLPFVQSHPVGFLNVMMLGSLWLLPATLYALLREVGTRNAVAAVGALCLAWLNPQLMRFSGHYALSYAWAIPLAMLFVVQFWKQPNASRMFNLVVFTTAVYFIHPYLGMSLSLLSGGVFLLKPLVQIRGIKTRWKEWLFGWVGALLPLAFYLVFVKLTDTHVERAPDAKGFLDYTSSFKSIFEPFTGFFRPWFLKFTEANSASWEGYAFVGVTSLLLLAVAFTLKLRTTYKSFLSAPWWPVFLITGAGAAVFACGLPFVGRYEHWLHKIPYLEQFRAPGRFAWIFYYTLGVWLWFSLSVWVENWSKALRAVALGTLLLVAAADGYEFQKVTSLQVKNANVFAESNVTLESLAEYDEIMAHESPKAILPIPFFHFGSDYYVCGGNEEAKVKAYAAAYHTGVPLLANSNPRVSLVESRNHLQLWSGDYTYKNMWDTLPSGASLYVLRCGEPQWQNEKALAESDVRWLKPEFERADWEERMSTVLSLASERSEPFTFDPITGFVDTLFYLSNLPSAESEGVANEYHVLAKFRSEQLESAEEWQASAWLHWKELNALYTLFIVEEKWNNQQQWLAFCGANQCADTYADSVLMRLNFKPKVGAEYTMLTKGSDEYWAPYRIGTFMLQPAGKVLVEPGSTCLVNGIPVPKVR